MESRNKNIIELHRGVSEYRKEYQPRTDIVKGGKYDLLADYHVISPASF